MLRYCVSLLVASLPLIACSDQEDPFRYELAKGGTSEAAHSHADTGKLIDNPGTTAEGGTRAASSLLAHSEARSVSGGFTQRTTASALGGSLASSRQTARNALENGGAIAQLGGANGHGGSTDSFTLQSSGASAQLLAPSSLVTSTFEAGGAVDPTLESSDAQVPCVASEHCGSGEYCDTSQALAEYQGVVVGVCASN